MRPADSTEPSAPTRWWRRRRRIERPIDRPDDSHQPDAVPTPEPGREPTPADVVPDRRVPVWPVCCAKTPDAGPTDGGPLGLGLVVAAIASFDGGRLLDSYRLYPIRNEAESAVKDVCASGQPGIMLLSSLVWSIEDNLALATQLKELSPESITIFGGPSAPKYEGDAEDFFDAHPQVDVLVRGEGEITARELLGALGGDLSDLSPLCAVDGLTVRLPRGITRTPDRARMTDPNEIPSPYLTGLFDHLSPASGHWVVESNRGCPYGCTFCDWGSATLARIRKFDLDRVRAEFDWLAQRGVHEIFMADANFGIFERDIEIADHVAELRRTLGAPLSFIASNAKNTTKHILPIIERLREAGLASEATISFQSTDEVTLQIVRRKNIKSEIFRTLGDEATKKGIPVLADVMLGLPGATMEAFKSDLQECISQDVTARVFGTIMLPNSPMNEPGYKAEYKIETDSVNQVIATSSYTSAERDEMISFLDFFRLCEHFGILRQVIRYAAAESKQREVDVLWTIYVTAYTEPTNYPLLNFVVRFMRRYLVEPVSWQPFYEEVGDILVREFGLNDGTGLRTALRVQRALMPSVGRGFPELVELEHDFVAYYRTELRPTEGAGSGRSLESFGPASLRVEDPRDVCRDPFQEFTDIQWTSEGTRGLVSEYEFHLGAGNWELESPLARPIRFAYRAKGSGRPSDSSEIRV